MAELGRSFIIGAEHTEEEMKQTSGSNSKVGHGHVFTGQKKNGKKKIPSFYFEGDFLCRSAVYSHSFTVGGDNAL